MISNEALEEFKEIYRKEFAEELTNADALDKATRLLTLMKHVYKPMMKEEMETVKRRAEELKSKS